MIRPESHALFADREANAKEAYGLWPTLAWFAGLLVLTALVGFILALAVFLVVFIRFRARRGWGYAVAYGAAGIAFMLFMAGILNRDFPPGLLQSYISLPWPFT